MKNPKPVSGPVADSKADMLKIVTHPAFRIGFLDSQSGRPLAHDRILDRIAVETPKTALRRIGWDDARFGFLRTQHFEIAQYRYEEGRLAQSMYRLSAKSWSHPDYPPVAVRQMITRLLRERAA